MFEPFLLNHSFTGFALERFTLQVQHPITRKPIHMKLDMEELFFRNQNSGPVNYHLCEKE